MIKVGTEREIKFDEKLRYDRQKDYDITNYESIPYEFQSGKRDVYKNFNFSIFIDDYCNADCKFCVAQLRYEHKGKMYCKKHIQDTDEYLKRLEKVLDIVRPLNPSVSITGGEPTLSPILTDVVKMVDERNFRKRTITSNGSGLFNIQDGDMIINNLIKYNFDHLNISRTHYDDAKNREIMRFAAEKEYCTMEMMKEIFRITNESTLHHRLSCLLLKEGINSVAEMEKYIQFYQDMGCNNFIFRELMDYDKTAVNIEKMNYCMANKIKLNEIWEDFSKFPDFERYLNILGYYYYVEIYKYKGATVASESADLNQCYKQRKETPNMVYEMVFHNNGNLCGSWIDSEDILDKYQ